MMGKFCDDLSQPVTKTTGGLIVLDRDHPLIHRYNKTWKAMQDHRGQCLATSAPSARTSAPRYLLGHPIEPHKAMRSLGFTLIGQPNVIGTLFCCECNLCTMMACPEDLDPKNVYSHNKHGADERRDQVAGGSRPGSARNCTWTTGGCRSRRLILKLGLEPFSKRRAAAEMSCISRSGRSCR